LCACPASICLRRTKPEGTALKPTTEIPPTSKRPARDHAFSGQDLIDRLKESKEQYALEMMADGRASGRRWAEQEATYGALLRISDICLGSPEDDLEALDNAVKPDPLDCLSLALEELQLDDDLEAEFVASFISGAQDVFDEAHVFSERSAAGRAMAPSTNEDAELTSGGRGASSSPCMGTPVPARSWRLTRAP